MKVSMTAARWLDALRAVGVVINTRSVNQSLRMSALRVVGGVASLVGCGPGGMAVVEFDPVADPGVSFNGVEGDSVLIDGAYFTKLLQTFPAEELVVVSRRSQAQIAEVSCQGYNSRLPFVADATVDDFYTETDFGGRVGNGWSAWSLPVHQALQQVAFAMAAENEAFAADEYQLAAVLVTVTRGRLTMQATDNSRLAGCWLSVPVDGGLQFLLPRSKVEWVLRVKPSLVYTNGHALCFVGAAVKLYCRNRLKVEQFPDLNPVFQRVRSGKLPVTVTVAREPLLRALRRQVLYLAETGGEKWSVLGIRPGVAHEGCIKLAGDALRSCTDTVPYQAVEGRHCPLILRVDPAALLTGLEKLDADEVTLFVDTRKAGHVLGVRVESLGMDVVFVVPVEPVTGSH